MIALVPARARSERLPGKNTRIFDGMPLISWTIDAAVRSRAFDYIVVSSDCESCLGIANRNGVLSYRRSAELAQDDTSMREVLLDFVWKYSLSKEDICVLYPTYPLRTKDDIVNIKAHWSARAERERASSMIGIVRNGPSSRAVSVTGGVVVPDTTTYRTQDEAREEKAVPVYCHFACVIKASSVADTGRNLIGPRTIDYWLGDAPGNPEQRAFETDTYTDFRLAEALKRTRGVA